MILQILGVDAERTQAMDEISPAVIEQHLARLRAFDILQQRWVIGMIGERESVLRAIAKERPAIQRPACQDRRSYRLVAECRG